MGEDSEERTFTPRTLEMVADRFKVLGEPTRLRLLDALREGERTVGELVDMVETSQANVSKHLGILRRHHMVRRRKEGVHTHYSIADPAIFDICDLVCAGIEERLDARREELGGSA
jgi:ArsR family transcriptional regulator